MGFFVGVVVIVGGEGEGKGGGGAVDEGVAVDI